MIRKRLLRVRIIYGDGREGLDQRTALINSDYPGLAVGRSIVSPQNGWRWPISVYHIRTGYTLCGSSTPMEAWAKVRGFAALGDWTKNLADLDRGMIEQAEKLAKGYQ